jgi:hypothetical protein
MKMLGSLVLLLVFLGVSCIAALAEPKEAPRSATQASQPSGGSITGTVVRAVTGAPAANALVELRAARGKVITTIQTDATQRRELRSGGGAR